MGSKAPLQKVLPDADKDGTSGRPGQPNGTTTNHLLGRIADALQVPLATLYNPPDATGPSSRSDEVTAACTGMDDECAALLHAYRRINGPTERRRILAVVQAAAEQP